MKTSVKYGYSHLSPLRNSTSCSFLNIIHGVESFWNHINNFYFITLNSIDFLELGMNLFSYTITYNTKPWSFRKYWFTEICIFHTLTCFIAKRSKNPFVNIIISLIRKILKYWRTKYWNTHGSGFMFYVKLIFIWILSLTTNTIIVGIS